MGDRIVKGRADPSAAGTGGGTAFEPFQLERETKLDGRTILFYSWPAEPPVPDGIGNVGIDATRADEADTPETEPWSPESGPAEPPSRDART